MIILQNSTISITFHALAGLLALAGTMGCSSHVLQPGEVLIEINGKPHLATVIESVCDLYCTHNGVPYLQFSVSVQDPEVEPDEGAIGHIFILFSFFGDSNTDWELPETRLYIPSSLDNEEGDLELIFYRMGTHGDMKDVNIKVLPLGDGRYRFRISGTGIVFDQEIPFQLLFEMTPIDYRNAL